MKFYLPDVLQYDDFDCGISCMQGICAYYGEDINEVKLIRKIRPSRQNGTCISDITDFFLRKGYKVKAGSMTISDLIKYLNKKIPVILLLQAWGNKDTNYETTQAFGHYVIAIGYDSKRILFEDPAIFGTGYLTYNSLKKRWHGLDGELRIQYGIAVFGKPPFNFKSPIKIK